MSDFLAAMAETGLMRAREVDAASLEARMEDAPPPVTLELGSFDVIAETKLESPGEGRLAKGGARRVGQLASEYRDGGAVAISVLTEETRFAGALAHLEEAVSVVELPVMRKDFLVHPIQVVEARVSGASGVLLIARMLPGSLLEEMTDLTLELGMFALVEVFDRDDLEKAAHVFDRDVLVGVNSRDLTTLEVDFDRFAAIAPHLPDHLPAVAESGITGPSEVAIVATLGYRLALVGSSLVSDPDPGSRLAGLIEAGRTNVARAGN